VKTFLRLAPVVVGYAVLGFFWLAVWQQFFGAMGPRLGHVGAGGMRVNDWPCGGPQCDFSAFWPAGVLARAGQAGVVYDPGAFLAARHKMLWAGAEPVRWFYPPPALLPVMAVSLLPFEAGFWVWTAVLTGLAVWLLRWAGLGWGVIAVGMLSPAALWNAELGQFGTVTGALVVASAMVLEARPGLAGALLGVLAIKPQAGILVGVAMLGRRRFWRGILVGVGVVLGLAAAVTMWAGWGVWKDYFGEGLAVSKAVVLAVPPAGSYYEQFGVSVFWALRVLGAGVGAAYEVQALVAACGAAAVWWVWRRGWGDLTSRMALTVLLSLLATPYGYTDDMVGYSVALAACAARRGWRIDVLDAMLFLWPAFCPIVFMRTGVLLTPVVVAVAGLRVFWRGRGGVVTGG
jgi:hypothetical protein